MYFYSQCMFALCAYIYNQRKINGLSLITQYENKLNKPEQYKLGLGTEHCQQVNSDMFSITSAICLCLGLKVAFVIGLL